MSKTFGLDELKPELKDPLVASDRGPYHQRREQDRRRRHGHLRPREGAGSRGPVALIPVSDYDAFIGNFEKADGSQGDYTAVKEPEIAASDVYRPSRRLRGDGRSYS